MFVNKIDVADPELVDLVVLEAQELLARARLRATSPVVRGSALEALRRSTRARADDGACDCIRALVEALDAFIPDPERDLASPFLMPIEDARPVPARVAGV